VDTPKQIRAAIEAGTIRGQTSGLAPGYAQANLVILPKADAFDFLLFCQRNEKPCPVIDVCEPGGYSPAWAAPGADLRTQLPRYRVHRRGELCEELDDIRGLFSADMVSFLLGCSFTFESALLAHGVPVRHIELGRNVPMYVTKLECRPAGIFSGPMVVSMRPMPASLVDTAAKVTAPFRKAHGAPIHAGDPEALGIRDLQRVDFGDPPELREGEVPVFWACGVTPQMALRRAKPELVITHAPGHMFISDLRDEELAEARYPGGRS
jgi:uncharacterized protein YcsI (UPF0317 family)